MYIIIEHKHLFKVFRVYIHNPAISHPAGGPEQAHRCTKLLQGALFTYPLCSLNHSIYGWKALIDVPSL